MNYVLMIHTAESRFANLQPEQGEAVMQAYGAYTRELFATGRAGDCAALEGTRTATCVRVRDGKRSVQDGPFAETREQLTGYYTIDAKSEDEALEWASKIPGAAMGTIEIRPVSPTPAAPANDVPPMREQKEYLLLIYQAEDTWSSLSDAEREKFYLDYRAFRQGLQTAGQFVAADRLEAVNRAKCVSLATDKRVVRDGPFAETREQLAGYFRVRAQNLDEAIDHAAKLPAAHRGTIEVRPVMDTSTYR